LSTSQIDQGDANRTVVEGSRQHDRDCVAIDPIGGASEHHIDRRSMPIDERTSAQLGVPVTHNEMTPWRSDVDPAALEFLAVATMACLQGPGPGQDLRQPGLLPT
jgi:hypothetical protein